MVGDQRNTAQFGYQRTISPNKIGKILSQMNHLTKMALGESYAVEIQASRELNITRRYGKAGTKLLKRPVIHLSAGRCYLLDLLRMAITFMTPC